MWIYDGKHRLPLLKIVIYDECPILKILIYDDFPILDIVFYDDFPILNIEIYDDSGIKHMVDIYTQDLRDIKPT